MLEEWKDIQGYEGLYQISNLGRVKSLGNNKTRKEKILSCGVNGDGYLYVILCKNGKTKIFYVHRLVSQEFLQNPNNLPEVDHINGIRDDNRSENIRWVTHKENCNNPNSKKKMSSVKKGKTPWNKGKKCKMIDGKRVWY